MKRAGWDPFDPSEECRKATALPWMPPRLTEIDRFGVYHNVLFLRLFSRFGEGTSYRGEQAGQLVELATRFALQKTDLKEAVTPELVQEWSQRVMEWQRNVFLPARKRIEDADESTVLSNPAAYEPAYTLIALNFELKLVDPERDRHLMAIGRAMHEENRKIPRNPVPTSEEEFDAYYDWLTSNGGALGRRAETGMIEIDPLLVKTELEGRLGRIIQVRGGGNVEDLEIDADAKELLEALSAVEQVDLIRQIRDRRIQEAEEGSARWHVLQAFFELTQGDTTFRALGERVHLAPSSLQEAFAAECAAIKAALEAA